MCAFRQRIPIPEKYRRRNQAQKPEKKRKPGLLDNHHRHPDGEREGINPPLFSHLIDEIVENDSGNQRKKVQNGKEL